MNLIPSLGSVSLNFEARVPSLEPITLWRLAWDDDMLDAQCSAPCEVGCLYRAHTPACVAVCL